MSTINPFDEAVQKIKDYVDNRHYTHKQLSAATVWNIQHNLNKHPSVTVIDSAGTKVYGDIEYIDNNNVRVTFTSAFAGRAYLN